MQSSVYVIASAEGGVEDEDKILKWAMILTEHVKTRRFGIYTVFDDIIKTWPIEVQKFSSRLACSSP